MKLTLLSAVATLTLSSIACAAEKWIPMFNGKDLTGWKSNAAAEKQPESVFSVKNGELIVSGGRAHLFYVGKDGDEYNAIVNTMQMHPDDMKELGVTAGATVRVRTEVGEATFKLVEAKVPRGMLFVPYGPPTCQLYGGDTDGTGMPTSKGWDVEVEPV